LSGQTVRTTAYNIFMESFLTHAGYAALIVFGFIEVPALQFGFLSLIGTVAWAIALSVTGYEVGSAWHSVSHYVSVGGYVIVALVVLAIAGLVAYRLREVRKETAAAGQATDQR
jgi:membrane protein DedA with SNARE-associated domain